MEAQMHEFAVTALAAGGKGGGRLAIWIVLIAVIVVLAVGWIMTAARLRAERADPPRGERADPLPGEQAEKPQ
jgi:flagellar basal body-associated protein FliL